MHKTLKRQIERFADALPETERYHELFEAISATYESFDKDRLLIERSLEISSEELNTYIALLQATLESINEGIVVVDDKGRLANHNQRFLEIWKLSEGDLDSHDFKQVIELMMQQVEQKEPFSQNIDEAFARTHEGSTYRAALKDGRTIEMNSRPQLVGDTNVGRVWGFNDITKHLKTEDELKTKLNALERMNNAMINRELKMIELKKKIVSLEKTLSTSHEER